MFGSILDFQGSQKRPLGLHFGSQNRCFGIPLSRFCVPGPTWARFCAENTSKSYFDGFGKAFEPILDGFLQIVGRLVVEFGCSPSAKRRHNDRRNTKITKHLNDKTTPPFGRTFLRPGGMRASAFRRPWPQPGAGRAEYKSTFCKILLHTACKIHAKISAPSP